MYMDIGHTCFVLNLSYKGLQFLLLSNKVLQILKSVTSPDTIHSKRDLKYSKIWCHLDFTFFVQNYKNPKNSYILFIGILLTVVSLLGFPKVQFMLRMKIIIKFKYLHLILKYRYFGQFFFNRRSNQYTVYYE